MTSRTALTKYSLSRVALGLVCGWALLTGRNTAVAASDTVLVDPAQSVIVLGVVEPGAGLSAGAARGQNDRLAEAAVELQKHIEIVTGSKVSITQDRNVPEDRYVFFVGIKPPDGGAELAEQEARWVITPTAAYLYGAGDRDTRYAVYSFLQDQLGIEWIVPGDDGIVYRKQTPLALRLGTFQWIPQLQYRSIRLGNARVRKSAYKPKNKFAEFYPDLEKHNASAEDVWQWQMRMRMYGSRPGGSHTFSTWWEKYGKTHPEYFALNKYGKREPVPLSDGKDRSEAFIKICASNPDVARQVITDWLATRATPQFVSVGVDDGGANFCECDACRALDVPREGEAWDDHLTDRYVVLANRVARMAREHRPDACATMYAYLSTLYPPRREKVEPNIVVQLVPYVDPLALDTVRSHFEGWREAGATMLMLRPNYHHKYLATAMPLGIEKQMFDVFQLAYRNGCIATDYDSLKLQWAVTGISDYILARSMGEPEEPFEHWAQKYYAAFGNAANDVRNYYEYWRHEVWEKRLQPEIVKICDLGGAGDFDRGLFWSLGKYYTPEDFARSAHVLEQAAAKDLTDREAKRVRQLQLVNEHARLTYLAVVAKPYDKPALAEQLLAFRRAHKDDLQLDWPSIFGFEKSNGDLTGMLIADEMKGYLKPWMPTELFWKFQPDPEDVGLRQNWQKTSWTELTDWQDLRTDRTWENQFAFDEPSNLPEDLAQMLTSYDGIGWYATLQAVPADWKDRQVYLRFGAVDESCWVYLNGTLAGEHIYRDTNDWKTPFEIRIDTLIDWERPSQQITVRVEDKSGLGGIWRPVWLVSKAAQEGE